MERILPNQTSNGSGDPILLSAKVEGNSFSITIFGTFDSDTVTIEVAPDGENYA